MDSIKFSGFLPQQSLFCIYTATFCLPSQIWILFEIYAETICASALIYAGYPFWSSTLTIHCHPALFYIIERLKYNKMEFYSIIRSILRRFPPGKWVLLGRMVKGGSKQSEFLIFILWTLLRILVVKSSILE